MNSPYMGNFKVTQEYKGATHDGVDLVGQDSKNIHSTVNGVVEFAGWENPANHSQGFGQYVKIVDSATGYGFYFGHLSSIKVKAGDKVKITDVIGVEGSTGNSTGSHCHYCIRKTAKELTLTFRNFPESRTKSGFIMTGTRAATQGQRLGKSRIEN